MAGFEHLADMTPVHALADCRRVDVLPRSCQGDGDESVDIAEIF